LQTEILRPGPLLAAGGGLNQIGWSRQPLLDCNLEQARFYALRPMQFLRVKRWDYYAIFTPERFFSATIADLGYAGNLFVYTVDFQTGEVNEEGLVIPLGRGIQLPRNSTDGLALYEGQGVRLKFITLADGRRIEIDWPAFHAGRGLSAEIQLDCPPEHESMTIVIPIANRRFYYNRKINCLPASGQIRYGAETTQLAPETCLGSLDWGRGVWAYRSFWNWASASGFLADGRTIGLNLGGGFGDLSAASENAFILDGRLHKLDSVPFQYNPADFMQPWQFCDSGGRLELEFIPFAHRKAQTNLGLIFSEVHQIFGRYRGTVTTAQEEQIEIRELVGFAEEHQARW
jgi:hypothetical protein